MKKLNLLSRAEMKNVIGGVIPPEDDCAGQSFYVETSSYCGYGFGIRMENGDCVVMEPTIKTPQPCGIA